MASKKILDALRASVAEPPTLTAHDHTLHFTLPSDAKINAVIGHY